MRIEWPRIEEDRAASGPYGDGMVRGIREADPFRIPRATVAKTVRLSTYMLLHSHTHTHASFVCIFTYVIVRGVRSIGSPNPDTRYASSESKPSRRKMSYGISDPPTRPPGPKQQEDRNERYIKRRRDKK